MLNAERRKENNENENETKTNEIKVVLYEFIIKEKQIRFQTSFPFLKG